MYFKYNFGQYNTKKEPFLYIRREKMKLKTHQFTPMFKLPKISTVNVMMTFNIRGTCKMLDTL